jgi:alkylation response protein AidB-like acyl-CoA dehydrogenase
MLADIDIEVPSEHRLLARLAGLVTTMQANAQRLDPAGGFPEDDIAALREDGVLAGVLPRRSGGLGIGIEPDQALVTAEILRLIGAGSVALGRIFEAHLNALRLVIRYATPGQIHTAEADVRAGHLHALWVTDGARPLRYERIADRIELDGEKCPCSAAGHATRAVITASDRHGETRLLLVPLGHGEQTFTLAGATQGVRGAATGRVGFSGVRHSAETIFGAPGDYLREPDFSAGAWRASAVTVGGLCALVDAVRAELVARGRLDHPQQRERLGRMLIHAKSARLWLREVAPEAEGANSNADRAVPMVNLARIAIEAACLDTIQLVQRSLGLSAFMQSNKVERMCRDLATYLRQPAPDEALDEAAGYFAAHPAALHGH